MFRIIVFLFAIFLFACSPKISFREGTFIADNRSSQSVLFFQKGNFAHSLPVVIVEGSSCCDTASYGSYEVLPDEKLLALSTSPAFDSPILPDVQEKGAGDSLVWEITCPLEAYYQKHYSPPSGRNAAYKLLIQSNDADFDKKIAGSLHKQARIAVLLPKHIQLKSFALALILDEDFQESIYLRDIKTISYQVQNPQNTIFQVRIPSLEYGFITYPRYKENYVRILDKNRLKWKGRIYTRKK